MKFFARMILGVALFSHVAMASASSALILCNHSDGQAFIEFADAPCCLADNDCVESSNLPASLPEIRNRCCNCVDTAMTTPHAKVDAAQYTQHYPIAALSAPVFLIVIPNLNFRPAPEISLSPQSQVVLASLRAVVILC